MKTLLLVLLAMVVISLFSGLWFMYRDKGNSRRVVIALTIRVALSVLTVVVAIISVLMR